MTKSILSASNSVAVLVSLLNHGGTARASFLIDDVGNYNSVKAAAKRLDDEGLITTMTSSNPPSIVYELTPLGFKIATELKRAEDILAGNPPEDAQIDYEPSSKQMDSLS